MFKKSAPKVEKRKEKIPHTKEIKNWFSCECQEFVVSQQQKLLNIYSASNKRFWFHNTKADKEVKEI